MNPDSAKKLAIYIFCLLALSICPFNDTFAQQNHDQQIPETPIFRLQTNLILTRFHVVKDNFYVHNIKRENIRILQDKKAQQIAVFEGPLTRGHTITVEIVFVFDVSFSVIRPGLLNGRLLKEQVIDRLGDHVSLSVYGFAKQVKRFSEPTRDFEILDEAIHQTLAYAGLGTRLYQSIEEVCYTVRKLSPNSLPVLVVLSDGLDTTKAKAKDALAAALESDVKLYPVVLGHLMARQRSGNNKARQNSNGSWSTGSGGRYATNPGGSRPEFRSSGIPSGNMNSSRNRNLERELRMEEFAKLGRQTGGRSFDPLKMDTPSMEAILQIVVENVRSEYVAGYYAPPGLKKGKHKVKVLLNKKSLGKVDGGEKVFVHGQQD